MKKKIYLSASTLNIYRECKRCFWLHVKKGIKRPRGPMPSITTGLDLIIKEYFEYYRKMGQLPPILEGKIPGKLIKKLEKTYYYDIDENFCLFGKLDECMVENGKYAPLDHKTRASKPEYKNVHEAYKLQMSIYSLLLKENKMDISGVAYLVYYYPETSKIHNGIIFGVEVIPVKTDIEKAREFIREAIECLQSDELPESSENCEYCKWIESVKVYYPEKKIILPQEESAPEEEPQEEEFLSFEDGTLFG